jgi:holliday junction DNA helicase RuvB
MTSTINAEFAVNEWASYVGQRLLKTRLEIAVRSAKAQERRLDHVLLDGPPGAGKSTMAGLLAQEMNEPLMVISEPLSVRQLMNVLYDTELGAIVLLDEIQDYPNATKNALLPWLEAGFFQSQWFPYQTVVACTTNPEALKGPLLDRFPILGRYDDYSDADMAKIVARFAESASVQLTQNACRQLGVAAAGVPRVARSFVIAARDLSYGGHKVTVPAIMKFCHRHPDGLSTDHIAYLEALHANRDRAGLEVLCARLRMHRTLVQGLERLLLERKFLFYASDGRTMTAAGRARLQEAA